MFFYLFDTAYMTAKWVLFSFLTLLTITLGFFFYLKPTVNKFLVLKAESLQLQQELRKKKEELHAQKELNLKFQVAQKEKKDFYQIKTLPNFLSEFLENISQIGNKVNVEFRAIKNNKPIKYHGYYKSNLTLVLIGNYHCLVKFINQMMYLHYNLEIINFSLRPLGDKNSPDNKPKILELMLNLAIYN